MWASKLAGKPVPSSAAVPMALAGGEKFQGLVLGIDPSLRGSGVSVLEVSGPRLRLLKSLTLKIRPDRSMPQCLGEISKTITAALRDFPIRHVALEQTIYVQNFQTAQILGAARGAAIAAAAMIDLPIFEYPPLRVKQAVSGFGRASKEQVAGQVKQLLNLPETLPLDESDAAAVAICHAFTWRG